MDSALAIDVDAGAHRISPTTLAITRPSLPPLPEYVRLLRKIWRSRQLTNAGPLVRTLERRLASASGARHVRAVANGTLALQLAYRAIFPRRGVVVTTPFTFVATASSLIWEGLEPRFADIDPDTFNLDRESLLEAITPRVVGIVAVHVFGNTIGAGEIARIGQDLRVPVVFDAAQAFGVSQTPRSVFQLGAASTLSFHATKVFHTFEGGAVITDSQKIARRIALLRNFGLSDHEGVAELGINAKMSEAHAAMGLVNLEYLSRWIGQRKRRYERYVSGLSALGMVRFQRIAPGEYSYPYMPILLPSRSSRDRVFFGLAKLGVAARRYFFPLTSIVPGVTRRSRHRSCHVAESVSSRILALPLYPSLALHDIDSICGAIKNLL